MIKVLDNIKKELLVLDIYFKLAKSSHKLIIKSVYKGTKLIWNLIKSCFGSGLWFNNSPWSNSDGWKNNK